MTDLSFWEIALITVAWWLIGLLWFPISCLPELLPRLARFLLIPFRVDTYVPRLKKMSVYRALEEVYARRGHDVENFADFASDVFFLVERHGSWKDYNYVLGEVKKLVKKYEEMEKRRIFPGALFAFALSYVFTFVPLLVILSRDSALPPTVKQITGAGITTFASLLVYRASLPDREEIRRKKEKYAFFLAVLDSLRKRPMLQVFCLLEDKEIYERT